MPGPAKRFTPKGPIEQLAFQPFCMEPDLPDLTDEQKFALHQFVHTVLAAGYALYQIVPPELANPIIEKKLRGALKIPG